MPLQFQAYSALTFLKQAHTLVINDYQIDYLAFSHPETADNTPLVFLGGAFQNFMSFKKEVQMFWTERPVILLDLPSQGSNCQLCPELDFSDFALLINQFLDHAHIEKIHLVGLSYGSAMAFQFAADFPNRIGKLILGGTTPKVREDNKYLLKKSLKVLERGDRQFFAHGVVENLINLPFKEVTQIPERVINGLFKAMLNLDENSQQRYIHNTSRLIKIDEIQGQVKCPTLILTGEYDNFTTPYENYLMAQKIPGSEFVLIKNGDHLSQLEKRPVLIDLYQQFLLGSALDEIEQIHYLTGKKYLPFDQQLDPQQITREEQHEADLVFDWREMFLAS